MQMRIVLVFLIILFIFSMGSCSGEKHLPSSNPPEYDPRKITAAPAAPPSGLATPPDSGPPPIQFSTFEPGPNDKGEWKTVPVKPESVQLFNDLTSPCDALSKIIQGVGSAQLFAGTERQALK